MMALGRRERSASGADGRNGTRNTGLVIDFRRTGYKLNTRRLKEVGGVLLGLWKLGSKRRGQRKTNSACCVTEALRSLRE